MGEETACFYSLADALPFWLLANSDEPDLFMPHDAPAALALSAVAFDRLVGPKSNANELAEAFANHFRGFGELTLGGSLACPDGRHVGPDPKYKNAQLGWHVHRKWFKELYELRSQVLHGGGRREFSSVWSVDEHFVAQAFVFPHLLRLILRDSAFYQLSWKDEADCEILDCLLDANDWGFTRNSRRNWSALLGASR